MKLVTRQLLEQYLQRDVIDEGLRRSARPGDEALTCQRWLLESPAKRLVYHELYGDLLASPVRARILDVGGGLTALTRDLARRHDYDLVDLMAHEESLSVKRVSEGVDRPFVHVMDWYDFAPAEPYDVVIANDLFPNVDQRLELFLDKYLPLCGELRVSLTYYNTPRFYRTRRIDGDEMLCMLAWNGQMTRETLTKFEDRIRGAQLALLVSDNESVYANGRQVCILQLVGAGAPASKVGVTHGVE